MTKRKRKQPKEQTSRAQKKYRSTPHGRYVISTHSGLRKGLGFDLTESQYDTLMIQPCYYCNGSLGSTGLGLDRINNSIGYTLTNVLPCCKDCNRTRGDRFSVDETKAMIDFIKEYRLKHGKTL